MAKASNAGVLQFVSTNAHMSTTELLALAKKSKLNYTKSQISYYKTKLNKVALETDSSKASGSSEVEMLQQENAVLKNTIGSLLVTIGQLVRVSR